MKQLFINSNGQVELLELPEPSAGPGRFVVKTHYSVISPGTELAMIRSARQKPLLKKVFTKAFAAKVREKLAQDELLESIQEKLPFGGQPHSLVSLRPVGYSSAGVISEIGSGITGGRLVPGTAVACAGSGHATCCETGPLLLAKIPPQVDLKEAAFSTLGSIAIQGIRRGDVVAGQTVVVLGLGILGQLTAQILEQIGARVILTDLNETRLELAQRCLKNGISLPISHTNPVAIVNKVTHGLGADVVIITAASPSSQPINQAVAFVKPQGKIVVVGDVRLDLVRRPFYLKEADLVISRAYGPGRYDADYEKKALDYPPDQVRWTMQRHLETFLKLLAEKKLNLKPLITHEFHYLAAAQAYQKIAEEAAITMAVVLNFTDQPHPVEIPRHIIESVKRPEQPSKIRTAVLGGSNFAKKQIIPTLLRHGKFALKQLITSSSVNAKEIALSYHIPETGTARETALCNPEIDLVVIANKHHQHAEWVVEALRQRKHVFVEKPIALTLPECHRLIAECQISDRLVFVDFNRRFAPLALQAKTEMGTQPGPFHLHYRIAANGLPLGHWINDPAVGGGRLLGEACHFFDWVCWLFSELPQKVLATGALYQQIGHQIIHRFQVQLTFGSGSTAQIFYNDLAPRSFPKERIEIFTGDRAVVLDNFETLTIYGNTTRTTKLKKPDKGYAAAYSALANAIMEETPSPITWRDGVNATIIGLKAIESIEMGQEITFNWNEFFQE
jgi:polar amino acid transport system substrate-binding protein